MADHLLSDAEHHRIRHRIGLDRTVVANHCRGCGKRAMYEFDTEGEHVRERLGCPDCDQWEAL